MKELPKQFSGKGQVKGYEFNQISATPYGYIYAKTSAEGSKTFEVFKRLENAIYNCISYPTDKAFGIWAWNPGTKERALKILLEIGEREGAKKLKLNAVNSPP
ncbi:hypothetical protein LZ575_03095 [Antarcticibacterium sp. 1MA-6-2]|uniref:hypothetical protein n=1 Tax=Antarcticibacterium sp. 1MA-6-2 TaxID=2908210 RepID=UPI001F21652A|nr:hypothetical protein [Antarcticibacterium sp. 1MA-6-2]UJH91689.1 hypothetical protein LZ575_03095 [Antarcticibacterium sp. 1MA-6-2]